VVRGARIFYNRIMRALLYSFVALFSLVACSKQEASSSPSGSPAGKGRERKPAVAAYIAKPLTIRQSLLGVGTVLPAEQIDIKTEIAGRVIAIHFREGQPVSAGTLLLKLDDSELRAERSKAVAKVAYLRAVDDRKQAQLAKEAASRQEAELATAERAQAEAELALLDAKLTKTEIRAPFTGVLGLRQVSPGAVVSSGQVVTNLVQPRPAKVEFSVAGDWAPFSMPGQTVVVRLASGLETTARVIATDGALQTGNRSLKVRAALDQSQTPLPGSAAEVRISSAGMQGFLVPPDALSGNAQGPILFLHRSGKVIDVPVRLGVRTGNSVQILEGLAAGDTVLCMGAQPLRRGMSVQITEIRE